MCLRGSGTILIHSEQLQISDATRKQKRVKLKSFLSRQHAFIHNLEYKKCFKFLLAIKVTVRDKSQDGFATESTLNFSGPYRRVRPAKLTNHSARNTKRYNKSSLQSPISVINNRWKASIL